MIPSGNNIHSGNKILVQASLEQLTQQKPASSKITPPLVKSTPSPRQETENDKLLERFNRYLRENNHSKSTIYMYTKTVELMFSLKNPLTLTEDDLHDVKLFLVEKYVQNGNRARFAAINAFCKHVLKREDLHLKIPGPVIKNKDVFTNEQIDAILAVAKTKNKLAFAILQTLYHCGLRKMELCNLNLSNLNFEAMELTLSDTKTGNAVVSMTNAVGQALQDYILNERRPRFDNEQAVFLSKKGERIGEWVVRGYLKECGREAGVKTPRMYPHMLRASCITHLLNKGVNPLTVQLHARHKNFMTTMRYNRPTQQQMKKDIEKSFS
jgi:integrase/recombinase XerD